MNSFMQRFLQLLLTMVMTVNVAQSSDLFADSKIDALAVGADFLAAKQQPDLLVRRRGRRSRRSRGRRSRGRRRGIRRSSRVRRSRPRRARARRVRRSRPRRVRNRRNSRRRGSGWRRARRYRRRRRRGRLSFGLGTSYYRPFYWGNYDYYPWSYSLFDSWNWVRLGHHGHYSGWNPHYGFWYPKWRFYHFGGWGYYYPSSYWGYGFWMYPFQDSTSSKKVRFIVYDWSDEVNATNRQLYFQNAASHDLHFGFYTWNEQTAQYHRIGKRRVIASKAIGRINVPRLRRGSPIFVLSRRSGDIGKRLDRNDVESLVVRDTYGSGDIQIKVRSGKVHAMSSRLRRKINKIEDKIREDKRIFNKASRWRKEQGIPSIDEDSGQKGLRDTPEGVSFRPEIE